MTENNKILWQTKLHARLHDPAEKALVLLRDPAGHEGGTSRVLWRMARADEIPAESSIENDRADVLHAVAFDKEGIKPDTYRTVQRADWWAAAADRPNWPMQEITITTKNGEEKTLSIAPWAQVRWTNKPILIHPLTGQEFNLGCYGALSDTDFQDIKQRSFDHFSNLLVRDNGSTDFQKSLLAFWRFGPEVQEDNDYGKLGSLWNLLPADTRVPDHSIWDHLDLTSAFAGAFTADEEGQAALLALSIGPVQPFIAAARKLDDLWAGSHLLSRLSWEAMKVICERLGPDAILFPRLRGIPQVDLWLRDSCKLPKNRFEGCDWNKGGTDANPLFSAALPNRFVAVVPASQTKMIADRVEMKVREWLQGLGKEVVSKLLTAADYAEAPEINSTPYEQMKEQLNSFPEVHWAAVPFSLIHCRDEKRQRNLDVVQLSKSMKPFFAGNAEPGFLGSHAWDVLQQDIEWDDYTTFFAPNPGVLYPAVHDLAERVLAAAKSNRAFESMNQQGWRCSLTGESEWLTTDRAQLVKSYRNQDDTLWTRVAQAKPAWAKPGEHLGALSAIKRLWPNLFLEEVRKALGEDENDQGIQRFVVSTHTMALAHQLREFLVKDKPLDEELAEKLRQPQLQPAALPRKLARSTEGNREKRNLVARIPNWLDAAREVAEEGGKSDERELSRIQKTIKELLGPVEAYYGLVLMDGDQMGAILAGDEKAKTTISYQDSFHPQVRQGFKEHAQRQPKIEQYGKQGRAISPNRHLAISGALNDFSLTVARHVVEEEYLGRLIYAGGDDVLAMLPVADLLPAMQRLRYAYSGQDPEHTGGREASGLTLNKGFAILKDKKLMRMMGEKATASCGAVIAHHQAPLTAVLRELRVAEQCAKNEGGRDAFSITIIKRSGGALYLTEKWGEPVRLMISLRDFLACDGVSRRAVYHTLQWLNERELPANAFDSGLAQCLLAHQFERQADGDVKTEARGLASNLIKMTITQEWPQEKRINKLRNFLSVAEFLARETRTGGLAGGGS